MRCLHCTSYNLKNHPAHTKMGYGRCLAANIYKDGAVFMSLIADVECDKYSPADDEIKLRREEWYASRKGR